MSDRSELSDRGELRDRVAIVTGGSGGIGRAIAVALVEAGATVVIADRDEAGAGAVAAQLPGARAHQVDLADVDACRTLIRDVASHHGRLDILVNGAGFQHIAPVTEFPLDRWDAILATMLTAPFILIQAALPIREVVDQVMLADSAIPRLLEANEVAAYVRFLCSDSAGGITGSAQMIDGGWTAH